MSFDLLPFDKIIHLDADVVVLGSLNPLIVQLDYYDFIGVHDYPHLTIGSHVGDKEEQLKAESLFRIGSHALMHPAYNAGVFSIKKTSYNCLYPIMEALYASELLLPLRD